MTFETKLRSGLSDLFKDQGTVVVIDSIQARPGVLSVRFHLDGAWDSPAAGFFAFPEEVPLEETLEAFRDSVAQSWKMAHQPPSSNGSHAAGTAWGD